MSENTKIIIDTKPLAKKSVTALFLLKVLNHFINTEFSILSLVGNFIFSFQLKIWGIG
jgi:hypothetical protein